MLKIEFAEMRRKNKLIYWGGFAFFLFLIILILGSMVKKKNVKNTLQLDNPLLEDLKVKNGSSFQIGSYTVSLADGVYEQNPQLGYFVFKITNRNGRVDTKVLQSNQLPSGAFGKEGRFTISIMATHSRSISTKYDGDILYITYRCEMIDNNINNCICLDDNKTGKKYFFSFDTVEKSKKILLGKDGTMYISSLGFLIISDRRYSIENMKIILSDGDEKEIISKEKYRGSFTASTIDGKTEYIFNSFFDKVIDYSKIDKLIYNGNSYLVSVN